MAVALLYQVTRARLGTLELDASVAEEHTAANEITSHPVERGSNVADHIRPLPETISIEGIVSNTPIRADEVARAGEVPRGSPGRAEAAFATLMELRDKGVLLTVVTKLRTYENMAIESLRIPRNARVGDALTFTVQLRRVRLAQLQTVTLKLETATPKGRPKVKLNKQVASPAPPSVRNRSTLDEAAEKTGLYKALGVM